MAGRLHDRIAAGAGQFGSHVANHLEANRFQFEHLADILAQVLERAAAVGATFVLRCNGLRFTRQMCGKLAPRLCRGPAGARRGGLELFVQNLAALRIGGFEFLDPQFQLLDLLRTLLALVAELQAAQFENLQFERFDHEPV